MTLADTVGSRSDAANEPRGMIGRSIPNRDGVALVTGKAKYTCDLVLPDMAFGKIVRSQYAHARIVSVDTSAALALDGVLAVITPDDFASVPRVSNGPVIDMPLLAQGKVRYSGEPVAGVIAETEEIAEMAAELVQIDYEELPAVFDMEEAMQPGAPTVHDPGSALSGHENLDGNVCWRLNTKVGDIEAAFRNADLVVSQRFRTSRAHAMPMETHGALASWDVTDQLLTVWSSTQNSHLLRGAIATAFDLPQSEVRVIKPFVGGAFGHKTGLKSHEALAVAGTMRVGRPVRVILSRWEEFATTVTRTPHTRDVEIALRSDGTVLGWREKIIEEVGAYAGLGPSILALSEWVTVGPYRTPALDIEGCCVYTNKPHAGAYRGFGNPQATFARELMFDICARKLGLDPVEFRRRNVIRLEDLPCTTANGLKLQTLPIEEAMDKVLDAIGYDEIKRADVPNRGVGMVNMIEWGGGCRWLPAFDTDMSSVSITMNYDGSLVIGSDAADSGQGHVTLFTMIAADVLGVDPTKVRVLLADTDKTPFGLGTYASRTSVIQGTALHRACLELKGRLLDVAAHMLEVDPRDLDITNGEVIVKGTATTLPLIAVAASMHLVRSALPEGDETSALSVTASYDAPCEVPDERGYGNFAANYTCSTTAAVVDVDPVSGKVTIVDWASAEDVGRVMHPAMLDGQVQGGVAQGIGYALGEDQLFDEAGTMINASMVDYQVPTAPMVPMLDKIMAIESFDPTHPMGNKGIGESGITPCAAAIACAVFDAIGVAITSLPLSPQKVAAAMAGVDSSSVNGSSVNGSSVNGSGSGSIDGSTLA
jgi:aerobic carbon-monoxide dehydrogenase large subunit